MAYYIPNSQFSPLYTIPQDILQDPQTQNMNMPDGYAPDMNANEWYLSDAETLANFQYTNTEFDEYQPSFDVPGFVAVVPDQPPSPVDNAPTLSNDSAPQTLEVMDSDPMRTLQRDIERMTDGLSKVEDCYLYKGEVIDFDNDTWFMERGLCIWARILQPVIEKFYQNKINRSVGQLPVHTAGVCDPSAPITQEHSGAPGDERATDDSAIPYGLPTPPLILDAPLDIPNANPSIDVAATEQSAQVAATAPVYSYPETIVIPDAENIAPEQSTTVGEQSLASLDDRRDFLEPSERPTKRTRLDTAAPSTVDHTSSALTAHHSSRRQPRANIRRARKPLQPLRQNAPQLPAVDATSQTNHNAVEPAPLDGAASTSLDASEPTPLNATEPTPLGAEVSTSNAGLVLGWNGEEFPLNPAVVAQIVQAYATLPTEGGALAPTEGDAPLPAEGFVPEQPQEYAPAPVHQQDYAPAPTQSIAQVPQQTYVDPSFFPQVPYYGPQAYGGYTYGFAPAPVPDNFAPAPVYEGAPMTAYNGLCMDAYGNAYVPQMDPYAHQPFTYAGQPIAYDNQPVASTTNTQLPTPPSTMYSSSNDSSSSLSSNAASSGTSSSNTPSSGSSSSGSSPSNSSRSRSDSSSSTSATSSSASPAPTADAASGFKDGTLEEIFGPSGRAQCRWDGCACTTTFTPYDAAHAHTLILPHICNQHGARPETMPADAAELRRRPVNKNGVKNTDAYQCRWMVEDTESELDADGNPKMRICGAWAGSRSDSKGLSRHIAETHLGRKRYGAKPATQPKPTAKRARKAKKTAAATEG
ncbi:hypothetical protein EV122DRAFT_209287 [Schizophyllum commune]